MKQIIIFLLSVLLLSASPLKKPTPPQLSLFYKGKEIQNQTKMDIDKLKDGELSIGFTKINEEDIKYYIEALQIYIQKADKTWEIIGGTLCLDKDMTTPMSIPINENMNKSKGIAIEINAIHQQKEGGMKTPIQNSKFRIEILAKK